MYKICYLREFIFFKYNDSCWAIVSVLPPSLGGGEVRKPVRPCRTTFTPHWHMLCVLMGWHHSGSQGHWSPSSMKNLQTWENGWVTEWLRPISSWTSNVEEDYADWSPTSKTSAQANGLNKATELNLFFSRFSTGPFLNLLTQHNLNTSSIKQTNSTCPFIRVGLGQAPHPHPPFRFTFLDTWLWRLARWGGGWWNYTQAKLQTLIPSVLRCLAVWHPDARLMWRKSGAG